MFCVNNKNQKTMFLYSLPHDHIFYHKNDVPYTIDVVDGEFQLIRGIDNFVLHGTFVDTNEKFTVTIGKGYASADEYGFFIDYEGEPYVNVPDNTVVPREASTTDICVDKNGEHWEIVRIWRNSILLVTPQYTNNFNANIITAENIDEYFDSSKHESLVWLTVPETFYVVDTSEKDPESVPEIINRLSDCLVTAKMTTDGKLHVSTVYPRDVPTGTFDDESYEVDLVLEGEDMFKYIRRNLGGWL